MLCVPDFQVLHHPNGGSDHVLLLAVMGFRLPWVLLGEFWPTHLQPPLTCGVTAQVAAGGGDIPGVVEVVGEVGVGGDPVCDLP